MCSLLSIILPEYKLLNKNLNFCLTPGNYKSSLLQADLHDFTRKIKLRAHFDTKTDNNNNENDNNNTNTEKPFYIKGNSTWEPKDIHHTVKTFIDAIQNEFGNLQNKHTPNRPNLTKDEKIELINLQTRNDIIITNADKGGAVVIQDVDDYIAEAQRQLNDDTFYKKLSSDLTSKHNKKVNDTIDSLNQSRLIDDKTTKMLKTSDPKTPKFYTLPKIHKKNNPGRPVISPFNCHTTKISQFVDHHLQKHVQELPSYIKDTTDFINKTKDIHVPHNSLLVTMDVSSLYTNIPNDEGIYAIRNTLTKASIPTSLITVITTFLTLILPLNNFVFNGIHYLQTKGCAMGTKCAPSYANLFMGEFEFNHIYPPIHDKSTKYLRYIDDIFLLWTGTENQLNQFIETINNLHHSIKFTVQYSSQEITFLDTTVYIKNSKQFTKTYKKTN